MRSSVVVVVPSSLSRFGVTLLMAVACGVAAANIYCIFGAGLVAIALCLHVGGRVAARGPSHED